VGVNYPWEEPIKEKAVCCQGCNAKRLSKKDAVASGVAIFNVKIEGLFTKKKFQKAYRSGKF